MNTKRIQRATLAGISLACLSACSTIKGWFPDKERDYQFTSEIPELIVPEDLKNKGMAVSSAPKPAPQPAVDVESSENTASTSEDTAPETPTVEAAEPKVTADSAASDVATGAEISSLQIDQAKTPATRMVGRALSRQQIEIVERNIEKGYFYVKYDPNAVDAKDESIWDELNFMFGDDPSQEREYRIRVRGVNAQMSEVTVQDESGKPLSNHAANSLLKLITDGINQVLNQTESSDEGADDSETQSDAGRKSDAKTKPDANYPQVGPMEPLIQE